MFGYSGIRRLALVAAGVASCTVVLVTAISPGDGHVAVWMGVSTRDAHAWLQAGIERTGKQRPAEYIEVGKHGRQISLLTWPTRLGHRAQIRLAHRGSLWRITIDGHSSRWTWLPDGHLSTLALLETYRHGGAAYGVAAIDGRRVTSK